MKVWLDDTRVEIDPRTPFAQGGEADLHDLGDGRVLKLFKPASHPDFDGLPDAQCAADARIAEHQAKLPAFPTALPPRVVAPIALARRSKKGEICGYAMPRVAGDALYHVGEIGWRRAKQIDLARVTAALVELGRTVERLHARGIVIGDFNDLNVLVDGERAWLIDADSFQFGAWRCGVFSERFVDPRLCDPATLAWIRPHDRDSDWYAFASMAMRSLLGVGPYGGVHAPADPARRVVPARRAHARVSIYDAEVRAPKAALPTSVLPDELNAAFHDVFARGVRGAFPIARLVEQRWRTCACGAEHARASCPVCRTAVAIPATIVRGGLRATKIDPTSLAPREIAEVWITGDLLYRRGALGPEVIGQVLGGRTRVWTSATFGVGFYRAGAWTVGFVFRPDRRGLDDRITLPKIRGQLVDAHAVVGADRAWLFVREAFAG
ncbi:MAG TPA: hypothetical protein VL463_23080, partial [Kofleriaceae bacterium]|nr:hypothetical protein [Kofleriaceae bacterium]